MSYQKAVQVVGDIKEMNMFIIFCLLTTPFLVNRYFNFFASVVWRRRFYKNQVGLWLEVKNGPYGIDGPYGMTMLLISGALWH